MSKKQVADLTAKLAEMTAARDAALKNAQPIAASEIPIPPWSWYQDPANFQRTAGCGWREVLALLREYENFAMRVLSNSEAYREEGLKLLAARVAAEHLEALCSPIKVPRNDDAIKPLAEAATVAMRLHDAIAERNALREQLAALQRPTSAGEGEVAHENATATAGDALDYSPVGVDRGSR